MGSLRFILLVVILLTSAAAVSFAQKENTNNNPSVLSRRLTLELEAAEREKAEASIRLTLAQAKKLEAETEAMNRASDDWGCEQLTYTMLKLIAFAAVISVGFHIIKWTYLVCSAELKFRKLKKLADKANRA